MRIGGSCARTSAARERCEQFDPGVRGYLTPGVEAAKSRKRTHRALLERRCLSGTPRRPGSARRARGDARCRNPTQPHATPRNQTEPHATETAKSRKRTQRCFRVAKWHPLSRYDSRTSRFAKTNPRRESQRSRAGEGVAISFSSTFWSSRSGRAGRRPP
jgi:hypothetical protein